MTDYLERAEAELTTAAEAFNRERAKLLRPDGTPKYSEATQREMTQGLIAQLHAVAERHHNAAEAEIAAVNTALEAEHDDPAARLSTAELQAASARATFVREDAQALPLPDLVRRVRGVQAAGGDKVSSYLWSRYGRGRIATVLAQHEGRALDGTTRQHVEALEAALATLEGTLGAAVRLTKPEASARIKRARDLQFAISQRVRELDGSREAQLAAMRANPMYNSL